MFELIFADDAVLECLYDTRDLKLCASCRAGVEYRLGSYRILIGTDIGDQCLDRSYASVIRHECFVLKAEPCLNGTVCLGIIIFAGQKIRHDRRQLGRVCLEAVSRILCLVSIKAVQLSI